ncbi:MAG: peptidase U32 family protein, partial [Coriobacteriales bacterium]
RELSLEQIKTLREELPDDLELECFVHGSMCMAYSGRCLISDFMAGRSALSGHCAQSCRWHYTLEEEKRPGEHYPIEEDANGTYIMNAKDLNMLAHLDELEKAGIDSVKIEGRNKKAFYVASVVNAYRQVLDGADPSELAGELESVSHRPYSTGFFFGNPGQDLASDGRQQRVEWAAEVLSCTPLGGRRYRAEVRARNAFDVNDVLEVLSPHRPVRRVHIGKLRFCPESEEDGTEAPEPWPESDRANRTMERYELESNVELHPHDIIRKRLDCTGLRIPVPDSSLSSA